MFFYLLLYLLCLFVCFRLDYPFKSKAVRGVLLISVYLFLCFGYMTGSDWRVYELVYNGEASADKYLDAGEIGFFYLLQYVKKIISDFWVFSALVKILYIFIYVKIAGYFTNYKYSVLGASFGLYTLFMVISCPYRFLIASTFILIGLYIWFNYNWKWAIPFLLLAPMFHAMTIVVVLILLPINFFVNRVVDINKNILYLLIFVSIILSSLPATQSFIYDKLIPLVGMEGKGEYYSDYSITAWFSLGTLKFLFFYLLIVYKRKEIIKSSDKGKYVFYYCVISLLLQPFFHAIPTAQRFVILPALFISIALITIAMNVRYKKKSVLIYALSFILLFTVSKEAVKWDMNPYSNSLYYILTDHLPYNYRYNYNLKVNNVNLEDQ